MERDNQRTRADLSFPICLFKTSTPPSPQGRRYLDVRKAMQREAKSERQTRYRKKISCQSTKCESQKKIVYSSRFVRVIKCRKQKRNAETPPKRAAFRIKKRKNEEKHKNIFSIRFISAFLEIFGCSWQVIFWRTIAWCWLTFSIFSKHLFPLHVKKRKIHHLFIL